MSEFVPKTTNRTAGVTPFLNVPRKIQFSASGITSKKQCVRNVQKFRMFPHHKQLSMNKLYYLLCPDGILAAFAFKGPIGNSSPGFLGSAVSTFTKALQTEFPDQNQNALIDKTKVLSVLPVKDPITHQLKTFQYDNGKKTMYQYAFVHVHDDVECNNHSFANNWTRELVATLNQRFNANIYYGGNAGSQHFPVLTSLDQLFQIEDVANLAMVAYKESIRNGSFFDDIELFSKYFKDPANGRAVINNAFGI